MKGSMGQLASAMFLGVVLTAASSPAVETEVEAPGPAGPLKGAMLAPADGGAPVIVMIPGSGPTGRDGDSPRGLKASIYRLLAKGLAARGVATVRIDKRGMFASHMAVADANAVTIDDYATDVHAWVAAIRQKTSAPCVWVLGHSEGGGGGARRYLPSPPISMYFISRYSSTP